MPSIETASVPAITRIRGIVKWFRPSEQNKYNFGFITQPDGSDIFVHGKNVRETDFPIEEGDNVEFVMKTGRDGKPTAGDVRKVRPVLPANFKFPG